MKKALLISFALSMLTLQAVGQQATDKARTGSIYSKVGVGIPNDYTSSSAQGLGGLGVSYFEANVATMGNPAVWGQTVYALASGGFSLEHYNGSDFSGSVQNASFQANHFQLQLPVNRNKLGISASVTPLTRSNYRILNQQEISLGSGTDQMLSADVQNLGSGGISSIELGVGYRLTNNISIGYAGSLVLASLKNNITTVFENANYQTVDYTLTTSGTGFGNRLGLLFAFNGLFNEDDNLRLGTAYSLPVTVNGTRYQEADIRLGGNSLQSVTDETGVRLGDGDLRLPMKLSGGLTYQLNPKLSFSAEGLFQPWTDYDARYGGEALRAERLTDRYKSAFGIRYFPFMTGSDQFLSQFKYRAGVSYDTGHINIGGKRIETVLFSAGIGIPSPNSNSSIDINFHYGIRGTEAQNLVQEAIWGVELSVNLAEFMFYRPKLQ